MPEEKILIIKFGGLGDVILSINAIFSIFKHHKKKIVLLTEKPFDSILKKTDFFDQIITVKRGLFYFFDLLKIKQRFSLLKFSHVYDLQTSKRSSYYLKYFVKKGAITNGIGKFAKISHLNPKRNEMHTIDRQKDQLKHCNVKYIKHTNFEWLVDNKISLPKKNYGLIIPGGSKNRPYKRIPLLIYKNIIDLMLEKKIQPILIGSHDDKEICEKLSAVSPEIVNLCQKVSIGDIYFLSKYCLFSVGNDTGPVHVAAKGNNKTIVLFTRYSKPELCRPVGKDIEILNYKNKNSDFFFSIKKSIQKLIDC